MDGITYNPLSGVFAEDMHRLWSDKEVILYTNIEKPCTMEQTMERIGLLQRHDVFVILKGGEAVGITGCPCVSEKDKEYGLFYQIKRDCWGKGMGTQAAAWVINFMQSKYGGLTLLADVITDNTASERILAGLGFRPVSETRNLCKGRNVIVRHYRLKL